MIQGEEYDHSRHYAAVRGFCGSNWNDHQNQKRYIWDFVFKLSDGTEVTIHPEFSRYKLCAFTGELVHEVEEEVPEEGGGLPTAPAH